MDKEALIGTLIWAVCVIGCAVLFFGIGVWAKRSKKPVHFWSGIQVDPKTVIDIPGYNLANAKMWQWYSVPYFLSGILGCFGHVRDLFMNVAVIILIIACVPGIILLIWRYKQIEKAFIFR